MKSREWGMYTRICCRCNNWFKTWGRSRGGRVCDSCKQKNGRTGRKCIVRSNDSKS